MSVSGGAAYDSKQNFNSITRFLHSFRHEILGEYLSEISTQIGNRPIRILDVGCATGKAFSRIDAAYDVDYTGIDLSEKSIDRARDAYRTKHNARFMQGNAADPALYKPDSADVVLSLETLEHIPERDVVRIVENVCRIVRPRLFIASVPVEIGPSIWIKTLGSKAMGYNRTHYSFSQAWNAGLYRLNRLPPHGVSHLGFNWFWLEQTIRHNATIQETRSLPFRWLPKFLTPTVMIVAKPAGTDA